MLREYEGYNVEQADTSEVLILPMPSHVETSTTLPGDIPAHTLMLPPQRGHRFHQDAVEYLVYYFVEVSTTPGMRERAAIAEDIGLSPTQVHNWFKMSRRKARKSVPMGMVY
jgi:hypothetical protein